MIWLIVFLNLVAAGGWSLWMANRSTVNPKLLLVISLIITLGTGSLSLIMFWLGLIGVPLQFPIITGIYWAVMLPGWGLWFHQLKQIKITIKTSYINLNRIKWLMLFMLASICITIIFNAMMFPFYRDDTLGIYAPFAVEIATTNAIVPITPQRNLYELYPQHMSMTYAYVFLAAGWENPYPGLLLNALLSLTCLAAVFLLAQELFNKSVAWVAVFVLALLPDFGNWASAGYVDLPMAAYYTLGALFAWRMKQHRPQDAILAGIMIGLAAWTKNAALVGILIFFTFLFICLIFRQIRFNNALLSCIYIALITIPWYIRNWLLAGSLTPDTVWVEQSQQTLKQVFVLVTLPQNYGLSGWVMLAGVLWISWQLINNQQRAQMIFLLAWSIPYYLTWFLYASYDPRFILLFSPLLAVMGGKFLVDITQHLAHKKTLKVGILTSIMLLSMYSMWNSVDYKRTLLQRGWLTHEQKEALVR